MSTETGAAPTEATAPEATEQTQQAEPTAAEVRRMFKLKVNGKEEEVGEDEVVRRAQISSAMHAKAQKMGMSLKQYQAFEQALENDPETALLSKLGAERFQKAAVSYLQKQLQHEMMSPEQRRFLAMEQENARLKAEFEKHQEAQKQATHKQLTDFYAKQFDQEIPAAMKSAGLPQSPSVLKRFTELMTENIQHDINLPAEAIARLVKDEMRSDYKTLLKGLGDEDLDGFFDEDLLERQRKAAIAKAKAAQKAGRPVPKGTPAPKAPEKDLSMDDFRAYVERLKNGEE